MAMAEPEADPQLLYDYPGYQYQAFPYNYNYNYGIPATTYTTYPRVYHSYGEREADAEPEADPALIYTNTLPFTPAVHSPIIYKTEQTEKVSSPLVYTHSMPLHQPFVYNSAVQTPLVYNTPRLVNTVYNTALTSPLLPKVFPSLKTFTTSPVVSHIAKREAEADPALVYTTGVHQPIVHTPQVYTSAVQTPLIYNSPAVQTPFLKTMDNAVVPAVGGYIHSSHVGVCTNNHGIRVPC